MTLSDTTLTTDSRRVARHFKKRHADVLRAVENLQCSDEYRQRNFALTMADVAGPKGAVRQEPLVRMTKDGFMFMVMGFTGSKAARTKVGEMVGRPTRSGGKPLEAVLSRRSRPPRWHRQYRSKSPEV